jgi:hypothetical protein
MLGVRTASVKQHMGASTEIRATKPNARPLSAAALLRGTMMFRALSLAHYRRFLEASIGPLQKVIEGFAGAPDQLSRFRAEFESLAEPYYCNNQLQQSYLLTRASVR